MGWLRNRLIVGTPCRDVVDMTGRKCIVTGCAEGGLGFSTALQLLQMGATVVVTTRSATSAQDVAAALALAAEVREREGEGPSRCQSHQLDLTDDASVSAFVEWYAQTFDGELHVLVNNGGVHFDLLSRWKEPKLTPADIEVHWHVNFLGTWRLTLLLLDCLEKGSRAEGVSEARVVNVISELHQLGSRDTVLASLESGNRPQKYGSWHAYGQSKLASLMCAKSLSSRMHARGVRVTVNCLHPGGVRSNVIAKGLAGSTASACIRSCLAGVERWILQTPLEGSQTPLFLAISPEVNTVGGLYFRNCKEHKSSKSSMDTGVGDALFDGTVQRLFPDGPPSSLLLTPPL